MCHKGKEGVEVDLDERQLEMSEPRLWDFSDLKALFLSYALKRLPELSHTEGLIRISQTIMEKNGVSAEVSRPIDYDIAYGVWPDVEERGWEKGDWLRIYEKERAKW